LPKDSLESNLLLKDTTLELFTYPLDYEIEESGCFYHDPSIPADQPTWLYTAVPSGYVFPNVQYEILDECYIPDANISTGSNIQGAKNVLNGADEFLGALETEAFRITDNEADIEYSNEGNNQVATRSIFPSYKRPVGQIQVMNNALPTSAFQGVRHVKVRTHNFVKIGYGWTDDNGNYSVNERYLTNVYYSVIFENEDGFKIWGNYAFFSPAAYGMDWHSSSGYSRNIDTNSTAWLWATINNAAYDYNRKCETLNIPRPPSDLRIWNLRMDGNWAGSTPMARHIGLSVNSLMDYLAISCTSAYTSCISLALSLCMPDVFILLNDNTTSSRNVYETVYHELSHASHYQQAGKAYWLLYISHIVTNGGYGDGDEWLAGYAGVGEIWGNFFGSDCGRHEFGAISIWYDDFEDWYHPGFFMRLHNRNGFTERELYNCLKPGVNSINKLRDELIKCYPADTAAINQRYRDMLY